MQVTGNIFIPKPTLSECYSHGWRQIWKNFLFLFLVILFLGFADAPASVADNTDWDESIFSPLLHIFALAYFVLVLPVFTYGGDMLFVRAVRGEPLEIDWLVSGFRSGYVHIVLAHLLCTALIAIGCLFLIIPGIVLACRLAFVSYLVLDKGLEPIAAIEKSWSMTRGHGWRIFGMGLMGIPLFIAGVLCFLLGALVSVMWVKAAFASLYFAIDAGE